MITSDHLYDIATMLKALNDVDEEKAILLMSNPHMDNEELTALVDCFLRGLLIDKESNEPLKISNKVTMAGIRNKMNRIFEQSFKEIKPFKDVYTEYWDKE
jgi:hypothetical protein